MGFVPTGHRPIKIRHFYQAGDKFLCQLSQEQKIGIFIVIICRGFFVFCFFLFSELRCEVIVCFVDIDEFIDHNILNFLFMN